MDRFKYQAYLQIIESTNTKTGLLKLMRNFINTKHTNKPVIIRSDQNITPQFINRSKEQQIAGVLAYDLLYKTKQKYLNLGYIYNALPKYSQYQMLSINIDETIKLIKETECHIQ